MGILNPLTGSQLPLFSATRCGGGGEEEEEEQEGRGGQTMNINVSVVVVVVVDQNVTITPFLGGASARGVLANRVSVASCGRSFIR